MPTTVTENWSSSIPPRHRAFAERAIDLLKADPRVVGVAAGGSYVADAMDEFSDLDLVIALEPGATESVINERHQVAGSLGDLLTSTDFGSQGVLVCLYGPPVLAVDLMFVGLDAVAKLREKPVVLWERDRQFTEALPQGTPDHASPNLQWMEDRFWYWVHRTARKVGRGDLFAAIEMLSILRNNILAPLIHARAGLQPLGVRHMESLAPDLTQELRATVAAHDARDCLRALRACVEVYRLLRSTDDATVLRAEAEVAAIEYLVELERRLPLRSTPDRNVDRTIS